jgi:hypothetical protein
MFHVPSDAIADQCSSLNLIQLDHPNAIPSSPENPPSSSTASPSCSSISSLKAWRTASEQSQTPIFSFPHPVCRNMATNSSDELTGQHVSCIQMSAFDLPSSQEPTIPSVEDELGDLHWTTGVPYHMMDVFRANPFTAIDLPCTTSSALPSLDSSTNLNSIQCKIEVLHRPRSTTKHVLSPDPVEQKRKTRTKRARIQPPSVVPFPSTGPQEMFAYEFKLEIPHRSFGLSPDEDYRRCGDLHPSYLLTRALDDHEYSYVPQPVVAYSSEDVSMRSPSGHEYAELSLPPRLPYPSSRTASIPPRTRSDHHMQPSRCSLFPVPLSTHMSSHIREPSSPATTTPRQEIDDYRPQSDDHGCSSLPPAVPLQVMLERAQAYRPFIVQKPLYACPLCPRDFQLPNGLALHLKWHDRVGNLTMNSTPYLSRHPQQRVTPKHPHTDSGPLDTREVRHSQLPAQDDGQQSAISGSPPVPYSAPQETNPAQTESVSNLLNIDVCRYG